MKFINRKHELNHLEEEYAKEGAKFVVLYGRRRVGKTRLIEEFIRNKDAAYYLAAQETDKQQMEEFRNVIADRLNDGFLRTTSFNDWKHLFAYLEKAWPKDKRMILAIDEVTFVIKSNSSFPSYFQKFWDVFLSKTNTFVILSGSLVNLIIESVLSHSSPLYGRRTSQIFLLPFSFKESLMFMNGMKFEDAVAFHSLTGGVAKYLLFVEPGEPLEEFIEKKFLDREGFFYQEGLFLFSQEFKEPSTYLDIVKAIAFGNSRIDTISNFVGLETKIASRYLDILITVGFVKKIVPVTENEKKFRGAVYGINDNFLKFWNRFIYPNRSLIELRNTAEAMKAIRSDLNGMVGRNFEAVCAEAVGELIRNGKFSYDRIGTWWGNYREGGEKKTAEIDVVALNDGTKGILFGECKWKEDVNAGELLAELKKKAEHVGWNSGKRKECYAIFAKTFREKKALGDDVFLFDLRGLERVFRNGKRGGDPIVN